jgi:ribosome-associated heat shock protein Hsp15
MDKVRIDKWLWAARFYKTRSLAKSALKGGKVHIDGQKSKPGRILEVGIMLTILQGEDSKTIEVIALSEKRQGAPEAQLLYSETEQSVEQREKKSSERRAFYGSMPASMRPNKKQRRQIHRFIKI